MCASPCKAAKYRELSTDRAPQTLGHPRRILRSSVLRGFSGFSNSRHVCVTDANVQNTEICRRTELLKHWAAERDSEELCPSMIFGFSEFNACVRHRCKSAKDRELSTDKAPQTLGHPRGILRSSVLRGFSGFSSSRRVCVTDANVQNTENCRRTELLRHWVVPGVL